MPRRLILPAYAATATVDAFLAAWGSRHLRRLTKPLLMPLLAAYVATSRDPGAGKPLILAGLGLSGLGDIALLGEGDGPFTLGLASFLGAHCCYLAALVERRHGGIRRARWALAAYCAAWGALNLALLPKTGRLRLPVLAYGTALVAMAIAALDTGELTVAAGGAAFLASDGILALDRFGVAHLPGGDALVMITYTAAQALIAGGLVSAEG